MRAEVNQRLFNPTSAIGDITRILKLTKEIKHLKHKIEDATGSASAQSEDEEPKYKMVYRSMLVPDTPWSDLGHIAEDSYVRALKQTLHGMADGPPRGTFQDNQMKATMSYVMSFANSYFGRPTRKHCGKHRTAILIPFFAAFPGVLEDVTKFFELMGRSDMLHFVRDAVSDYVVSCDESGTPDEASAVILGGPVVTDQKRQAMTAHGWDILYSYFIDLVHRTTIEEFWFGFEDLLRIQRLIALETIPLSFGRMTKDEPAAERLAQELVNRVNRFVVVVYDMEGFPKFFSQNDKDEEDPWVTPLLAGGPAAQVLLEKAIRASIPDEEQNRWVQCITDEDSLHLDPNIDVLRYESEGNRTRARDVLEKQPNFFRGLRKKKLFHRESRTILKILFDMEQNKVITMLKSAEPLPGYPILLQGTDICLDLYISYDFKPSTERALLNHSPPVERYSDVFFDFSKTIQADHPKYFPALPSAEGHISKWNALAFDTPFSSQMWQNHINTVLNDRLSFACFCQTTFVVSANDVSSAKTNLKALLAVIKEHDWKISVPGPEEWTTDIDSLDLWTMWQGQNNQQVIAKEDGRLGRLWMKIPRNPKYPTAVEGNLHGGVAKIRSHMSVSGCSEALADF
ncbi:hypothetical protein N7532_007993 [Penicillium argentinense]|uniref:Uncharacterized protein n=1 Tax=Penicillium argentinense TaxID=1131581 RepID=A0A9W9K168_9EURO|nr:uncharacterized protein N7532_007993 [Penicillium argentinense]KAJ5089309.1 hypothetical protein N7532_007993 [Penicillium argentinense]